MRETSIMDNLNCKTHTHARVCEENKVELKLKENNEARRYNFVVTGASLKDHNNYRKSGGRIKMIFSRMTQINIKVLVQY